MKKILLTAITLIIFFVPLAVSAADSATEKLIQMERDTYGSEQLGAILDRLNRLEKDYSGKNMTGNLNVRIDSVYEILYGNIGTPSIFAKMNAIEWNAYNEVSSGNIRERLNKLERGILGEISSGSLIKRINDVTQASFGNGQIPLVEMQLPKDVLIKVAIDERVGSRTLQVGDLVDIKVAENVFIDGKLIFVKGMPGKGKVEKVRKAKGWMGKNGKIQIDFYTLNCIDGKHLDIYVGEEAKKEMTNQGMIKGASLVGLDLNDDWHKIIIRGKNIELSAGTELYVQIEKPVSLYALQLENKID